MSTLVVLFCALTANVDDCRVSPYDRFETIPMVNKECEEEAQALLHAGPPSRYYAIVGCKRQDPAV